MYSQFMMHGLKNIKLTSKEIKSSLYQLLLILFRFVIYDMVWKVIRNIVITVDCLSEHSSLAVIT